MNNKQLYIGTRKAFVNSLEEICILISKEYRALLKPAGNAILYLSRISSSDIGLNLISLEPNEKVHLDFKCEGFRNNDKLPSFFKYFLLCLKEGPNLEDKYIKDIVQIYRKCKKLL